MSITTTTLLDLTDTQMIDYAVDHDFSMHTSSDAGWLPLEATRSDDTEQLQDYQETIEVDMEPHVEDAEMED